jgi:hypothetical protein
MMDQPSEESSNHCPDYPVPDEGRDARWERWNAVERTLTDKAGLKRSEATNAVTSKYPITKEKAAKWLRSELRRLRDFQKSGRHPSRRGTTLSLLEISDIAFTMLEALDCVGDELLSLLQELLNLDRHRRSLAANLEAIDVAAQLGAQVTLKGKELGVRELARHLSISVSTASAWLRSPEYKERVALYEKAAWDQVGKYVEMIKEKFPKIADGHAFDIASAVRILISHACRFDRDLDMMKTMDIVFKHIRLLLKKPPIQIDFLPTVGFLDVSLEEMERQRTVVLSEITKLIGDPTAKCLGTQERGARRTLGSKAI